MSYLELIYMLKWYIIKQSQNSGMLVLVSEISYLSTLLQMLTCSQRTCSLHRNVTTLTISRSVALDEVVNFSYKMEVLHFKCFQLFCVCGHKNHIADNSKWLYLAFLLFLVRGHNLSSYVDHRHVCPTQVCLAFPLKWQYLFCCCWYVLQLIYNITLISSI